MQIDFHHATTYVVARDAGFSPGDADIIAYAAQYVDDATSIGTVYFDNHAVYNRISSAHKMLDPRNTEELANHCVWMPFHFLPGNGGRLADTWTAALLRNIRSAPPFAGDACRERKCSV